MAASAIAAHAVPAVAGEAAVAVQGPPFSLDYLSTIASSQDFKQLFEHNNTCIKFCRHLGAQNIKVRCDADFDLHRSYYIGVMDHQKGGPGFSFDTPAVAGKFQKWSPAKFIGALRSESIREMELDKHGGVLSVQCMSWPNFPDHSFANARRQEGNPFPKGEVPGLYDLVVTRGDRVRFALHPNHKGGKCKTVMLTAAVDERRNAGGSKQHFATGPFLRNTYDLSTKGFHELGINLKQDHHRPNQLGMQHPSAEEGQNAAAASSAGPSPAVAGHHPVAAAAASAPSQQPPTQMPQLHTPCVGTAAPAVAAATAAATSSNAPAPTAPPAPLASTAPPPVATGAFPPPPVAKLLAPPPPPPATTDPPAASLKTPPPQHHNAAPLSKQPPQPGACERPAQKPPQQQPKAPAPAFQQAAAAPAVAGQEVAGAPQPQAALPQGHKAASPQAAAPKAAQPKVTPLQALARQGSKAAPPQVAPQAAPFKAAPPHMVKHVSWKDLSSAAASESSAEPAAASEVSTGQTRPGYVRERVDTIEPHAAVQSL